MLVRTVFDKLQSLRSSDALYIGAERLASAMLNLIALIAVARFLGVQSYGAFALAMSILGIGLAIGHLGLDGLLLKKLIASPDEAPEMLGTVTGLKFLIYVPGFLASLLLPSFIGLSPTESQVMRSIAPIFLITPLTAGIIAWLNSRDRFRSPSLARILAIVLGTGGKLAIIAGGFGIVSIGLAHTTMFLLEFLILAALLHRNSGPLPYRWKFKSTLVKALYREAGPLFIASLAATTYAQLDILMLRYLTDQTSVGEYGFVQQILQSAQIIPFAITLAAFPTLVRLEHSNRSGFFAQVNLIASKIVAIGATIAVLLAIFGPRLIETMLGPQYQSTGESLRIGALALPFIFLRQLMSKVYICLGRGTLLAVIECTALISAIILQWLTISAFGLRGAAGAVIVTYAITSLSAYILSGALNHRRPIPDGAR